MQYAITLNNALKEAWRWNFSIIKFAPCPHFKKHTNGWKRRFERTHYAFAGTCVYLSAFSPFLTHINSFFFLRLAKRLSSTLYLAIRGFHFLFSGVLNKRVNYKINSGDRCKNLTDFIALLSYTSCQNVRLQIFVFAP